MTREQLDRHRTGQSEPISDWREIAEWDWVQIGNYGQRLHAVGSLTDSEATEREWGGSGTTACGRYGWLRIPGLFSRMGADRCARCCKLTGLLRGTGSPKNDDACRARVEGRIAALKTLSKVLRWTA